jgi:hypothetical protein
MGEALTSKFDVVAANSARRYCYRARAGAFGLVGWRARALGAVAAVVGAATWWHLGQAGFGVGKLCSFCWQGAMG